MSNNVYKDMIHQARASDELIEKTAKKMEASISKPKQPYFYKAVAMVACAAVLIFAVFALPNLWQSSPPSGLLPSNPQDSGNQPGSSEKPTGSAGALSAWDTIPALADLRGLSASHYTYTDGDVMADRMVYTSLPDYFMWKSRGKYDTGIAIVRVLDTHMVSMGAEEGFAHTKERQRAMLEVLYSTVGELPASVEILQSLAGGCMNDEATNLVRKGGVYVLSMARWGDDAWYGVAGELDCLFEVGADGLIYSHSRYEGFTKYDNKPLPELWSDIVYLSEHPALTSGLAMQLRQGANGWAAIVTRGIVTNGPNRLQTEYGGEVNSYSFEVLEQLSFMDSPPPTEIYLEEPYSLLTIGNEYIVCGSGATPYYVATVDGDGRIAIPHELFNSEYNDSAFVFAQGMSLDELRVAMADICAYYGVE